MKTAEEIFRECLTEFVGENCTDEQWEEVKREGAFKATIAAIERYAEQKLNKHSVMPSLPLDEFKYMCSECGAGYDCVTCGCPRCGNAA